MTQPIPLDGDLITAIVRLESVVGVLEGTAHEVPETIGGWDDTGMIAVVIRNTGSIVDLSIGYRRRDDLDPVELGSALTATIGDARNELLQDAEDYAAHHHDNVEDVDADRTRERTEEVPRSVLTTSLFVVPASVDDLVEKVLWRANVPDGFARDTKPFTRDDSSEISKPTFIGPTVVKQVDGQITGIDVDPRWVKNTPITMLIQRLVNAVVAADDPPIAAGNDNADTTILRLLSTLHSLPGKRE